MLFRSTSDDDSLLVFAEGYAKESFTTVDDDALDAVCEFTNCINGLYASELSTKDVNIDMMPPIFSYDSTITVDGEFYSIPLFFNEKQVNCIVGINCKIVK